MSAYVDDISENRRDDLMRVIRGAVEQPGRASVGRPIDEAVADAVIAWIDSGGVVVEEPEWGIAHVATPGSVWPLSEDGARETAAIEPGRRIIYSRPKTVTHEWVPVKQEGAETDA